MLTEEQKQLAADNYGLVFAFLNRYRLDRDTYHGIAAIGLCKAASIYDPSQKFSFSTVAYRCMFNELLHSRSAERKENLNQHQIVAHMESSMTAFPDFQVSDYLSYDDDFTGPEVSEVIGTFNAREKTCLGLWLSGAHPAEVQKAIGYGRSTVCNVRRGMKKKVLAYEGA